MEMSARMVRITSNCSLLEGSKNWPPRFPGEKAGRKRLEGPRQKGVDMAATKVAREFPWLHRVPQSWVKHTMEDAKNEFLSRVDRCSYAREAEEHLKGNTDLVHCVSTVQRHGAQQIKQENKSKQPFSSSSIKPEGRKRR